MSGALGPSSVSRPRPGPGSTSWLVAALVVAAITACAAPKEIVRRMPDGPGAEEVFRARFLRDFGRPPSYDERAAWLDTLDRRIDQFLTRHVEIATSPRATLFRFDRRVTPGMTGEEVTLLLGSPDLRTVDAAAMQAAAAELWTRIAPRAQEMWAYPGGWCLYLDGGRVAAVTLRGPAPLLERPP